MKLYYFYIVCAFFTTQIFCMNTEEDELFSDNFFAGTNTELANSNRITSPEYLLDPHINAFLKENSIYISMSQIIQYVTVSKLPTLRCTYPNCSKKFSCSKNRQVHVYTDHHTADIFVCPITTCKDGFFFDFQAYKKHMITHSSLDFTIRFVDRETGEIND